MMMSRSAVQHEAIQSTDNLRRQHRELLRLSRDIAAWLKVDAISTGAVRLRAQIAALSGVLNVHLAMEDGVMYPRLRVHDDPGIRAVAARYVDEMGGLKKTFVEYSRRWNTPEAMRAAPGDFIRESHAVLDALTHRIMREEAELYPLVDGDRSRGPETPHVRTESIGSARAR
jgi:hypothetical protein